MATEPESARLWEAQAICQQTAGLLDGALESYREAQLVNADRPSAQVNLGLLSQQRGEPKRAEARYREAIRIGPHFMPAYVNLDLRAALAMKIAGTQVDVILQIFNVLNSIDIAAADSRALNGDGDVVEGSRGGAVFAQPASYYFPRRFELGVRFSF